MVEGDGTKPVHRRWTYNVDEAAYTDTETGHKLPPSRVEELLGDLLSVQSERIADETMDLAKGLSTVPEWEVGMRRVVKETWGLSYLLSRGGRSQMTSQDWGRLGHMVRDQYLYLNGMAREIALGQVSAEMADKRSRLYVNGARAAFSRGYGAALGDVPLPAHPCDGSTECMNNCGCHWEIRTQPDGSWHATWVLGDTDHCAECTDRSERWAPLKIGGPA